MADRPPPAATAAGRDRSQRPATGAAAFSTRTVRGEQRVRQCAECKRGRTLGSDCHEMAAVHAEIKAAEFSTMIKARGVPRDAARLYRR